MWLAAMHGERHGRQETDREHEPNIRKATDTSG